MDEKPIDKLGRITKLANEKMRAYFIKGGFRPEDAPTVSLAQTDVVMEAANELGLSWKGILDERDNG